MPLETYGYDAPVSYDASIFYDASGESTASGAARATDGVSAKYKFFTADLLSNQILAEIPFKNVSYGRAIKNAGEFSGDIPVIAATASLDLYNSTMPGKTALYVVRDNECMWGGIIWSRDYNVIDKTLKVTGAEFTSYLHHRMIWKTYTHDFGVDVVVAAGVASATMQNLTYQFVVGSSVRIVFPTTDMYEYDGYYAVVTAVDDTHFTFAAGSIPTGSYTDVTVYSRVDTYDYVRQLLDEISVDFAYSSFANSDLQPASVEDVVVTFRQVTSNVATITTSTAHGIMPSQMVTISNVHTDLDGVVEVVSVPTSTTFTYNVVTANQSLTATPTVAKTVTSKSITDYVGKLSTATAHGFSTGDVVTITGVDGASRTVSFKQVISSNVTITTSTPHGANASDVITLSGVDAVLDGVVYLESVPSDTTMMFTVATPDIVKTAVGAGTVVIAKTIPTFDTTSAITVASAAEFTIPVSDSDMIATVVSGGANVVRTPSVQVASYGPYPGNSDIGLDFSTLEYSGNNVLTVNHRGFELANVGEELDKYSDTVLGFEYRVDCTIEYIGDIPYFTRTFVLIPIDFPDPPVTGEVSLPSRFGADRLVFEYPGNISNVTMIESAEDAATRFFVVGSIPELGDGAAEPYAAASATDLFAQGWPILEQQESRSEVSDEDLLYDHAKRYLSEARPPIADITITLNGSLSPKINEYMPGDWCSIIINDPFIRMRLASNLEVRSDVLVRKIDNYSVTVPDSPSFPEVVSITLITEALVDKIGE